MPPPIPTGIRSLPVELHIMILSHLSYLDHISCESVLPIWYNLISDPFTFAERYTQSKLRYTMTYPDERYLIHQLLRDCYFIVHSSPESKKAIQESDSMTVTLIPVAAVSEKESEQYPENLFFLDTNLFEHQPISSISGAMKFTDAPFLDDAVWVDNNYNNDSIDLSPKNEPDCNIWFYPASCSHKLGSLELPVKSFTIRDLLTTSISHSATASRLVAHGCQDCWSTCKEQRIVHIPGGVKPIYLQREHLMNWTYRNPRKHWMGIFAFERYFVNVQDVDDGEICGKVVKPWHWTSFWNQIVYDAEGWAPTKGGSGCVLLGLDDMKYEKDRRKDAQEGQYRWR
ncbi:hypothetical protein AOL_s00081g54 [Orbilia oligospora ATCC 24927]|uniref:F-box domain-containing protein n=2 Tax=Orbilia oligospora TaxID=2813651 RepID=G1XFB3_ARTOA|nr:hypothetical protein AOL_s00081g54 [Orbilia oligospora ATCC 24927]EGX48191.1 hypothetical protein AOL_s00081g54 [Orbilia oligospora ATCC 24927]KAF3290792.1 hypothetical protein TWF970_000055 [Orbilia oligospora]